MIAQGEFRELLEADSKERTEILRRVFATDIYQEMQLRLKEQRDACGKALDEILYSILQYFGDAVCGGRDSEVHAEIKGDVHRFDAMTALLSKMIDEGKEARGALERRKSEADAALSAAAANIALSRQYNAALAAIQDGQAVVAEKTPVRERLSAELAQLKSREREREEIAAEIYGMEESLPRYGALAKTEASRKETEAEKNRAAGQLSGLADGIRKLAEGLAGTQLALEHAKDADAALVRAENDWRTAQEQCGKLSVLENEHSACADILLRQKKAQELFAGADKRYGQTKHAYDAAEQQFYFEQAGILARNLRDGEECPVCGSKEHPLPAGVSAGAPTQADLEAKKSAAEKCHAEWQKLSQTANQAKTQFDTMAEKIVGDIKAAVQGAAEDPLPPSRRNSRQIRAATVFGEDPLLSEFEDAGRILREAAAARKERRDQLQKEKAAAEKAVSERAGLLAKQDRLAADRRVAEADAVARKDTLSKLETKLSVLEAEIRAALENLRFENEGEARAALERARNRLKKMKEALSEKQQEFDSASRSIAGAEAVLGEKKNEAALLRGQLGLAEDANIPADLAGLLARQAQSKNTIDGIVRELESIAHALNTNERILARLRQKGKEREGAEHMYGELCALCDTASGNLRGKQKVSFETYVQQVYFDQVLDAANNRLRAMTNGRFSLARQDAGLRGKTGLDLDVFDAWTGKSRGARSLSGGEAFEASLALALGLSDVVQGFSGGLELDAMFIDEGFGSLDSDSLERAMGIIAELAEGNRLVGLISHMDELKTKIDRRIVIERGRQGSRIRIEA
jgi:exonuclease SbcC